MEEDQPELGATLGNAGLTALGFEGSGRRAGFGELEAALLDASQAHELEPRWNGEVGENRPIAFGASVAQSEVERLGASPTDRFEILERLGDWCDCLSG